MAKGLRTIHRLPLPTVTVVKPSVPRSWFKRENKRDEYCRVKLQAYKPFDDATAYIEYLAKHHHDYYEAYKAFAES